MPVRSPVLDLIWQEKSPAVVVMHFIAVFLVITWPLDCCVSLAGASSIQDLWRRSPERVVDLRCHFVFSST